MPGLTAAVKALQARRAGLMGEVEKIDDILESLRSLGAGPVRGGGRRKRGGKWKPGHPGRPPKWYTDQQKGKGAKESAKRKGKRKRNASAKQLAAMSKARAALAAKRAAAK